MVNIRVIPCLLLKDSALVKTVRFKTPAYIGDPINTVRIFNEKEVDELCFLDIEASRFNRGPDFNILRNIANECFMPLSYGGGITNLDQVAKTLNIGLEKVVINSYAVSHPGFITEAAKNFGNQSIIGSIDVKKSFFGKYGVVTHSATKSTGIDPVEWAKKLEDAGAGEIMLTSVDREGTWEGFDIDLVKRVTGAVKIPVIANGGAGNVAHLAEASFQGGASALGVGSMVVFQKKGFGVLINYPQRKILNEIFRKK